MKAIILAGGLGTRISEESYLKPKPMIEIGGKPILWHIMKIYSSYGVNDFVVCLGYKGYLIKEYFLNYYSHMSDVTVDLSNNNIVVHDNFSEPWKVTLIDTGENSMTGGRLKRAASHVINEESFCFTYGDAVSDIDINSLIEFHRNHGKLATLTAIKPAARFGILDLDQENFVKQFNEKPAEQEAYINGGFFVLSPKVFDYIEGDDTIFEKIPLETLVAENNLTALKHDGFWQCMDTLRDKNLLEKLWVNNEAAWKVWS